MRLFKLTAIIFTTQILVSQGSFAQYEEESQNQSENSVSEKVYVQTTQSRKKSLNISRDGENCFYNDEHQHIHCYEDKRYEDKRYEDERYENENFSKTETRVVYRTNNRPYRDRYYSPSALSIGLAVGIPLLLHSSYRHSYRSHHRHHRNHYKRHQRRHYRSHNRGHRY